MAFVIDMSPARRQRRKGPVGASSSTTPFTPLTVGPTVRSHLQDVDAAVGAAVRPGVWSAPDPANPVHVPNLAALMTAADALDASTHAATNMLMIRTLLGRAADTCSAGFDTTKALEFPRDHHFHLKNGFEWYYVCANVPVKDVNGNAGQAAILMSLQRCTAVGVASQKAAMWSDADNTLMSGLSTVTVQMFDAPLVGAKKVTRTVFCRRSRNTSWGAVDGPESVKCSVPGESLFVGAGPDSISSAAAADSQDIFPLDVTVADGTNISLDFTVTAQPSVDKNCGWFYQGSPATTPEGQIDAGAGGTGLTPNPGPGFYYSWPQVDVVFPGGTFVANGETFTVTGPGNGWIDHQLIGKTLSNGPGLVPGTATPCAEAIQPLPFTQDAQPVNGWTWQFCNFADRSKAWTVAGFINGAASLAFFGFEPLGYRLSLGSNGRWKAYYCAGMNIQPALATATAPAGFLTGSALPAYVSAVNIPNDRTFIAAASYGSSFLGKLKDLFNGLRATSAIGWRSADTDASGNAIPITGEFNNGDMSLACETPANFQAGILSRTTGWGVLETVGFEPVAAQTERLLHYLATGKIPTSPLSSTSGEAVRPPS